LPHQHRGHLAGVAQVGAFDVLQERVADLTVVTEAGHALIELDGGVRRGVARAVDRADIEVAAGELVLDLPHQQRRCLRLVTDGGCAQLPRQLRARLARDGQAGGGLIGADGGARLVVDLAVDLADIVHSALQLTLELRPAPIADRDWPGYRWRRYFPAADFDKAGYR